MSDTVILQVNRGSTVQWSLRYQNPDGSPQNMAGRTVSIFDAAAAIAPYLSVAWADATQGIATITMTWNDLIPSDDFLPFRVRTMAGSVPTTTEQFMVQVT